MLPVRSTAIEPLGELVACRDCDTLYRVRPLRRQQRVICELCGARLCEHKQGALQKATAFAMSALVLFVVAHFFPFLSMEVGSRGNQIELVNSVGELYNNGAPMLAWMVAIFIIVAPAAIIAGMLYVLVPLLFGKALPGAVEVCKWTYHTLPWNMIEVFMLGVLVSLLKLSKLATVHPGVAFWAFALLIVCMTASFGAIDKVDLWRRLEHRAGMGAELI